MNDFETISNFVGFTIRELRLNAGFKSYEQFAHRHELSRIQYWKMENGNNFTLKSLLIILNIHQIELCYFLQLVENKMKNYCSNTGPSLRMQMLIDYSQLSKKEFSIKIGYKTLTALNKVLFGNQNISPIMCEKIVEAFPEINKTWLLKEEGEMLIPRKTVQ